MNKKQLSTLAKKAANVRWEKEREKTVQSLSNEVWRNIDPYGTKYLLVDATITYLISKYRITKR